MIEAVKIATVMTSIFMVHGGNSPADIANALGLRSPNQGGSYAVYFHRVPDGAIVGNGSASGIDSGPILAQVAGYSFSGQWITTQDGQIQLALTDSGGDNISCSYDPHSSQNYGNCSTSVGISLTVEIH